MYLLKLLAGIEQALEVFCYSKIVFLDCLSSFPVLLYNNMVASVSVSH